MQKMQSTLSYQLDELQKTGVNAIFFQVRAECDALYASRLELGEAHVELLLETNDRDHIKRVMTELTALGYDVTEID